MKINKDDLTSAADAGLLKTENVEPLWSFLGQRQPEQGEFKFDFTHVAYYFGALIVIMAMGWYLQLYWERSSGWAIAATALVYAAIFGGVGSYLRSSRREHILGGLLFVVAVCMTPILVYGIQRQLGYWATADTGTPPLNLSRYFHDRDVINAMVMEAATAACAFIVLRFVRFSFLLVPALIALLMLVVAPVEFRWLLGGAYEPRPAAAIYGLLVVMVALWTDWRGHTTHAFWMHLIGGGALWGAITLGGASTETKWLLIALFSIFYVWFSILLGRRTYAVFGAAGVFAYTVHLSETLFADSLWYPFVLTAFGILIISLGVTYHKKQESIDRALRALAPKFLQRLVPPK